MAPGDHDPPTLRYPGRDDDAGDVDEAPSERTGDLVAEDATTVSGVYAFGELLGRGGMGEVLLAHDRRIGRDVALKRMRRGSPSDDEAARFLREARIQARLEHPAIVPVYELARDPVGRPYFTMKRLSGVTLAEMLQNQLATRQRLLRAFVDVCRAVDYAHSRGVVHRDLKPANISLGEFGEVYVLDWGVARVIEDARSLVVTADIDTIEGAAPAGDTFGTPGYMAPEQLHDPEVQRSADIYSLGAILFEILAAEPLHPRGATAAIATTLDGTHVLSPAVRRPDRATPPELDVLCLAMVAKNPTARPTARLVADRLELYLDGDRDVARRKSMAIDLVWSARGALDEHRRGDAMRAASRALALDPEAEGAAELITTLMLQPPEHAPPELAAAIHHAENEGVSRHARSAIPGYLTIAAFMPIAMVNGVLKWAPILGLLGFALLLAFCARQLVRRPARNFGEMTLYAVANAALLVMLSRLAGPFTFVPALTVYITFTVMTYPVFLRRPWALAIIMGGGFLAPIFLELAGVLPRTWEMYEGVGLLSRSGALEVSKRSSAIIVVMASLVTILMAARQSAVLARANRNNQQRLVAQAWHLAQLLPRVAPRAPSRGVSASA